METFTEDLFKFREARLICDDKGARVAVMGGLTAFDVLRKEGMGNLFGNVG